MTACNKGKRRELETPVVRQNDKITKQKLKARGKGKKTIRLIAKSSTNSSWTSSSQFSELILPQEKEQTVDTLTNATTDTVHPTDRLQTDRQTDKTTLPFFHLLFLLLLSDFFVCLGRHLFVNCQSAESSSKQPSRHRGNVRTLKIEKQTWWESGARGEWALTLFV